LREVALENALVLSPHGQQHGLLEDVAYAERSVGTVRTGQSAPRGDARASASSSAAFGDGSNSGGRLGNEVSFNCER
jgi:hypothetical protein